MKKDTLFYNIFDRLIVKHPLIQSHAGIAHSLGGNKKLIDKFVVFYGISTFVAHLKPNPVHIYIYIYIYIYIWTGFGIK